MELEWTKVDFKNPVSQREDPGARLRGAQETLAKDLSLSLSAFLRTAVNVTYDGCREMLFGDYVNGESASCFGLALVRPLQCRVLLQAEYSILFPLLGIALGAKPGRFTSPERKPTEIELQVVNLVFRMVLSDAYRAWAVPLKTQLETVSLDIEPQAARSYAATEPVLACRFAVTAGENSGRVSLVAPAAIFAGVMEDNALPQQPAAPSGTPEAALALLMPAKVGVDVWLDGAHMRLGDLLQLREGQIVKLDHPVERKAVGTLNGRATFRGQIVNTGAHRAFMLEECTA